MATVGPDIAFRAFGYRARGRYIASAAQVARASAPHDEQRRELVWIVSWIEFYYSCAMFLEVVREQGVTSPEQLGQHLEELDQRICSVFPDVESSLERIRTILDDLPDETEVSPTTEQLTTLDWSQSVRSFDAIVAECPIDAIEKLAAEMDEPALSHAVRNAYDGLRAFVRRHDPACAEVARIVGDKYRRGHLALREAAVLMGMSASDAVFELEQNGYARPISAIGLSEEERIEAFARLRRRRLELPNRALDQDLVDRDVIASERIEGVDARAWIRRG